VWVHPAQNRPTCVLNGYRKGNYEALVAVAKAERRVVADVIRIALEEYMKTKGLDISFEVERGRPRQNNDTPDSE
jgi:hypothetical protein